MNIQKLTQKSQEALRNAQTYAQNNNNQMIEPCHIALALVSDSDGLIPSVISKCAGNRTAIIKELTSMTSSLPKVKMQSSDNSQIYVSQDTEKVLNIADSNADYARKVYEKLLENGIRAEFDDRNEKIGKKIREAQLQKIPYMIVVGDKEKEEKLIAVRSRSKGDLGAQKLTDFIKQLKVEIETKKND